MPGGTLLCCVFCVCCVQEHLPHQLQDFISRLGRQNILFTAEQLKQYTSDNPAGGGKIYMAILGEVFDVSAKPEFYGRQQILAEEQQMQQVFALAARC
jgi:hypothetical protein